MHTEYILTRSNAPPAKLTGECLGQFRSSNADVPDAETAAKQWFLLDLYRTVAGTYVAHIRYRAGRKLRREQPLDVVYTDKSGAHLMMTLDGIDTEKTFVGGWPNSVYPEYQERHRTCCEFAENQFADVLEQARKVLTPHEEPEEIT